MPRALDTVREVALLETYALPLERADALPKARDITMPPRARDAWSADHRAGERDVPRLLPISIAGITRQESRQALAR